MDRLPQVASEPDSSDERNVFAERVRLLYANAVLANAAVFLIDLVITGWYWDFLSGRQLALWWAVSLCGILYRLFLVKRYPGSAASHAQTERWLRRYLAGSAVVSLAWALITAFGLTSTDSWDRAMAVLLVTGFLGSSVSTLGSIPRLVYYYNLPHYLTALVMLTYAGGDELWVVLALVIYLVMVMYAVNNVGATLEHSLRLRFGNQRLARELGAAKERAEGLNRTLLEEVAQRKRAQEALEEHKRNLEKVVEERTAELTRAKDAAEAASRAKSRFLAAMSHEIRTPLNGVQGTVELLGRTPMTEIQRTYAETLGLASRSLRDVVTQILDFSRIEAGGVALTRQPLDAWELVERTCAQFAGSAFGKGVELVCRETRSVPRGLVGDPARLGQILRNLVANAVKFTKRGQVLVRLLPDGAEAGWVRLRFEVEDTGPGIPAGQEERVFQSFAQVDESDARSYEGTGLGLAIARELVTAFGGRIGMQAVRPHGALFWFTVLLETTPDTLPEPPPTWAEGLRLLVADDNAAARESLAEQLRGWGGRVDEVSDLSALVGCLAAAQDDTPYDILFVDRLLGGREVTAADLLLDGAARRVWLLPFDAEATDPDGACTLTKPLRREALQRCLKATDGAEPELRPVPAGATEEPRFHGLRILVAEDNTLNQMVIREMLKGMGCRPRLADNGAEALEMLEREAFDLIIMDCRMPVLDGFRATEAIRTAAPRPGTGRIPILALTANATEEEQQRALDAGMDAVLTKPATVADLAQAIARFFSPVD